MCLTHIRSHLISDKREETINDEELDVSECRHISGYLKVAVLDVLLFLSLRHSPRECLLIAFLTESLQSLRLFINYVNFSSNIYFLSSITPPFPSLSWTSSFSDKNRQVQGGHNKMSEQEVQRRQRRTQIS